MSKNADDVHLGAHIQITPPSTRFGVRHWQAILMALCSVVGYGLRANLSVGIVAMVHPSNATAARTREDPPGVQTFDWDEPVQGAVLSAFFWGYTMSQLPGGILSQRYGGCKFLAGALLSTSLVTMTLPQCAYWGGWKAVFANRVLQGLSQGFLYPSVYTLLGLWAPPAERSRAASFILGSQLIGPLLASPIAGLLAVSPWGWPAIFYSFGLAGLLAGALMLSFGADSPEKHPRITAEELAYLQAAIGQRKDKAPRTPWSYVLSSTPVWCLWVTMSSQAGVFFTFLNIIPTYLGAVLGFSMEENGTLTSLPYLTMLVLVAVCTTASDFINRRRLISLIACRKLFNCISTVFCALPMVLMGYSSSPALSVVLLCVMMGGFSATYVAAQPNYLDIAPLHSGPIYSVGNLMAATLGVIGPLIVGFVVTDNSFVDQWRIVFWGQALFLTFTNALFLIFAAGEIQPWNEPGYRRRKSEGLCASKPMTDVNQDGL